MHDDVIKWKHFRGTGIHRWIPLTKASDAELWCFLWSAAEHTVEQTIETLVIRDAGDLRRHRAHYDVTVVENNDLCYGLFRISGGMTCKYRLMVERMKHFILKI